MKRTGILIALFIFCMSPFAQQNTFDSLNVLIEELGNSSSDQKQFKKAQLYIELADEYEEQKEFETAADNYLSSLNILNALNDQSKDSVYLVKQAYCYHQLGSMMFDLYNYDEAIDYYTTGKEYSALINDTLQQAKANLNIGLIHRRQGAFAKAVQGYYDALSVFESMNDKKGIAICYLSIGSIHRVSFQEESAIKAYEEALEIFKELGDEYGIDACNTNLGITYKKAGNYTKALEFYTKVFDYCEKNGNRLQLGRAYSNIGMVYDSLDRRIAYDFHEKGLNIGLELNDYPNVATSATSMAYWHLHEYDLTKASKHLQKSIDMGRTALQATDSIEQPFKRISILEGLMEAHGLKGEYKAAYQYAQMRMEIKETLYNKEKAEAMEEIATRYQTEKKEVQIQLQEQTIAAQDLHLEQEKKLRNVLLIGASILLILAVIIFRGLLQKRRANAVLAQQKEEIETINSKLVELDRFKETMTGMIVHDLKNPLNTIINQASNVKIKQQAMQMLNMVLNILDIQKFEDASMNIQPETNLLSQAINKAIDQIILPAKEKNIAIENTIRTDLTILADNDLVERVLINLLSNAIKYTPNNGKVHLIAKEEGGEYLKIKVEDSGRGIPKKQQFKIFEKFGQVEAKDLGYNRSTGLGLTFCKMAIEGHGGKIGVESDGEHGSAFWFTLKKTHTEISEHLADESQDKVVAETSINAELIAEYIEVLKTLKYYEVSKIRKVIAEITSNDPSVLEWKDKLNQAVLAGNEELYNELLSI
ncbi:tetratricopeptide repeat-containing sensor histidine kinase [Carboxylicivirga sp. N1Y90]|uniref:tetratricopeptide repeat-containing sensor histidine kinase n=1 Tax=Carboxylicivirga fragile TaxID=3417571 RepID=UPI003D3337F2|nr:tetratricopeptide repeat-containing sensor histidine kinase [Marinilabiliaceae bacterium N1Y90]